VDDSNGCIALISSVEALMLKAVFKMPYDSAAPYVRPLDWVPLRVQ